VGHCSTGILSNYFDRITFYTCYGFIYCDENRVRNIIHSAIQSGSNLVEIIARSLPGHFITLLVFLLTFIIILLSLSSICIDDSNAVTEQQHTSDAVTAPVVIVPLIMQNLLTLICFLFLACFFVLGLRIQSASRATTGSTSHPSSLVDEYFLVLILSSLIPALIVTIYGIVLLYMYISGTLYTPSGKRAYMEGNYSYLLLLFLCFMPAGAVFFLLKKLHSFQVSTTKNQKKV
jgi:hypothetical protein